MFAIIGDGDDVGVRELGGFLGLNGKTFEGFLGVLGGQLFLADELDGNVTFKTSVEGFIHRRHPALAELFSDVIPSDGLTDEIRHIAPSLFC